MRVMMKYVYERNAVIGRLMVTLVLVILCIFFVCFVD